MLEVVRVPVLADNYAWLVHDAVSGKTIAVDPGEAAPVIAAAGPVTEAAKIPTLDTGVGEGDTVRLGGHVAQVMTVPGHTAGHIAFYFADDAAIFTGDTLFAMGCGRLFEGTPADMFANMQRYAELPDDVSVYCGHEYTQSNGRYALVAEPKNAAIRARMVEIDDLRARGEATIPTTIGLERATNPFLRALSAKELGERRLAKDSFRG
jgi:hydroxyacylglutathione hydrolase